ncbi:type II toxin-antitoxin system Phd/YefM family antitoxin [Candidatus Daviesbacteria bacterium]|nr:type II toxin-antitoxin system Phd/YefM family antitoxin [Candidatus Daviesbacteria bacterium]
MFTVNIRDISRNPKKVINQVKKEQQPTLVLSRKKPQAVIVSLEEYEELKILKDEKKEKKSAQALLDLVKLGQKYPGRGKVTNAVEEIEKMWEQWDT